MAKLNGLLTLRYTERHLATPQRKSNILLRETGHTARMHP